MLTVSKSMEENQYPVYPERDPAIPEDDRPVLPYSPT